jgi:hypothetical protein
VPGAGSFSELGSSRGLRSLGLDIGDQVEIGELQQLDGLHQLRRHDQRLALPKLKSLGKRH